MNIPKVIHYCWFGHGQLPDDALKCIESWRRFMPGYEIKQWNEDNFDIEACNYTAEAYQQRKYAFVSDYARFWILYNHGGLYFDTDVELIKPLDHILDEGCFMAIEKSLATNGNDPTACIGVNPGLGLAATKGLPLYKEIIDRYNTMHFDIAEGTVVTHTTALLTAHGMRNANVKQTVDGINIYPDRVFCPMDSTTGIVTIEPDTVSIHHYSCSWLDHNTLSFRLHKLKNRLIGIFGPGIVMAAARLLKRR